MAKFLTESEWDAGEKYNGMGSILRWGELEEKRIFSLLSIERKENAMFDTQVLHFADAEGEEYQVFCPQHFLKQI